MIRGPEAGHLGSPATNYCSSHNRLPPVHLSAKPVHTRKHRRLQASAQLKLGDQVTKHERLPPGDRTTSSRHCSTSYTVQADSYCVCGRPLTGRALQWWDKLEAHSNLHRQFRHRHHHATCGLAFSSSNNSVQADKEKRSTSAAAGNGSESSSKKVLQDSDLPQLGSDQDGEQPPETGFVAQPQVSQVQPPPQSTTRSGLSPSGASSAAYAQPGPKLFPAKEQGNIKESWKTLMRWSKVFKRPQNGVHVLDKADKVVVFGGGSFGTAMGVALARQRSSLHVALLLRDAYVCRDINKQHENTRYLPVCLAPVGPAQDSA